MVLKSGEFGKRELGMEQLYEKKVMLSTLAIL